MQRREGVIRTAMDNSPAVSWRRLKFSSEKFFVPYAHVDPDPSPLMKSPPWSMKFAIWHHIPHQHIMYRASSPVAIRKKKPSRASIRIFLFSDDGGKQKAERPTQTKRVEKAHQQSQQERKESRNSRPGETDSPCTPAAVH